MKKLSRLMLLGIPFLAFSGVSFGDDTNTADKQDCAVIKVHGKNGKDKYYLKSDDQSAVPVDEQGTKVAANKLKNPHIGVIFDKDMNPLFTLEWFKLGKQTHILGITPSNPENPPEVSGVVGSDESIDLNVGDKDPNKKDDNPASSEEGQSQSSAGEESQPPKGSDTPPTP